jgi:GDP-fucose protein O-fucosyltransferase
MKVTVKLDKRTGKDGCSAWRGLLVSAVAAVATAALITGSTLSELAAGRVTLRPRPRAPVASAPMTSEQPPRTFLLDGPDGGLWKRKLLFVAPRDDGFSNQRITVAEALRCAARTGRVAVLPLMFSDVRYGTKPKGPFLFRDYFDLDALADAAVVSFASPDAAAAAGVACRIVSVKSNPTRALRAFGDVFGWRRADLPAGKSVPGAARCVTQSVCDIDYATPAHFGRYSDFAAAGQGYNVAASANFRRVRAALRPSAPVRSVADVVLGAIGGPFNAVHLRRTDFTAKCAQMRKQCDEFGGDAFVASPAAVVARVLALRQPRLPLFVATEDPGWAAATLRPLLTAQNVSIVLATETALPPALQMYSERVDMRSFATQIICSRAEQFVGNRFSSFSSEINNERFLLRQPDGEAKLFF